MHTPEFFSTFISPLIEDEQKFIAYLLSNSDAKHLLPREALFDSSCIDIYQAVEKVLEKRLKVDIETVLDFVTNKTIDKNYIQAIVDKFTDFSNIEVHTVKRLKDYYTQRQIIERFDEVLSESMTTKTVDFNKVKTIAQSITEGAFELCDDSKLLTAKDLSNRYRNILIRRQSPTSERSFGFDALTNITQRPAAAEELSITFGNKGSAKSLVVKSIENMLVNTKTCVISFNLEMSTESNMDRLISIRTGIPLKDLIHLKQYEAEEPTRISRRWTHVQHELDKIEKIPNYLYYEEPTITLDEFEDMIYMGKKKFYQNETLPDDSYTFVTVDLGSMIKEFSGEDYKGLDKAINKLSIIIRKHKCHCHFVLQANESQVRGGRRFPNPESCDFHTLTMEDVFAGSSYAARARILFAINRPLLLKRRFFPQRNEEWDLEPDIMYINLAKENDGNGKLPRVPFIFPDDPCRIIPFRSRGDQ